METFRIDISSAEVDDLRRRLTTVRWPLPRPVASSPLPGITHERVQTLVDRWSKAYDWYYHQERLNAHPQFRTEIDGQVIHAVHARSDREDAVPLILLHGWPSTFAEYSHLIAPLTAPGDQALAAFHVVVPSLPGFGFSTPTMTTGWNNIRIAAAMTELMHRFGYERWIVHGSDAGQTVGEYMSLGANADSVAGLHINLGGVKLAAENRDNPDLTEQETRAIERLDDYMSTKSGYSHLQSTRPDTLGYALSDSPVGQLAWVAEKFVEWGDPDNPVDVEDILTTVSLYWFTRSSASAGRYYQEVYAKWLSRPFIELPVAISAYPHDIVPPIQNWARREFNVTQWTDMPAGGHFAALEAPELMLDSLRHFACSAEVNDRLSGASN